MNIYTENWVSTLEESSRLHMNTGKRYRYVNDKQLSRHRNIYLYFKVIINLFLEIFFVYRQNCNWRHYCYDTRVLLFSINNFPLPIEY